MQLGVYIGLDPRCLHCGKIFFLFARKLTAFIFFKWLLKCISLYDSGANLVSRDFVYEHSDLIKHRQFPVSLRCSLAGYYFSWWMYHGIKHTQSQIFFFLSELAILSFICDRSCISVYWQFTDTPIVCDLLEWGLGFLSFYCDF